ncbi:MAG: hypothetical protein EZS28_007332 [Streblomastix strix]|uniref:Uncharacterized protein n=1 Tax=Streblomastix strix TaxID=222440 RepID=A0A5J4WPT2_9EUKA|nr:MAG: hypothetical protein EZS28_007332 [Streblomastix strix]
MNVGVRLEEKEQEKEREDELKRMRDEVELKEEMQMMSFLKEKEKENLCFKDKSNLQEKETDGLSLFTDAYANIVMSDIYLMHLMMVKFVSGRMIAPSSKIEPGHDLELNISTNGCFKKLEDM